MNCEEFAAEVDQQIAQLDAATCALEKQIEELQEALSPLEERLRTLRIRRQRLHQFRENDATLDDENGIPF